MKFYNRDNELAILKKADTLKNSQGIMTILFQAYILRLVLMPICRLGLQTYKRQNPFKLKEIKCYYQHN